MEKSSEGSDSGTHCMINAFHAGDDPLVRVSAEIPSSKETILIAGFPGSGLVGSIAVEYLVEALSFTHIGNIASPLLPAVSLATAGLAQAPLRLYEKGRLLVVLSDVPVSDEGSCTIPSRIRMALCQDRCYRDHFDRRLGYRRGWRKKQDCLRWQHGNGCEKIKSSCRCRTNRQTRSFWTQIRSSGPILI